MTIGRYGVIYASGSKAVRRIVVSDDPHYDYSAHVGADETHTVVDEKNGRDLLSELHQRRIEIV